MPSDSDQGESSFLSAFTGIFSRKKPAAESDSHSIHCDNIDQQEKSMIEGVLALSDLNAREIMIPRVDTFSVEDSISLKELIDIVSDAGHSRIPVYHRTIDDVKGILYVKDLLQLILDGPDSFDLKKMLHKPLFIPETMPLDELLIEFQKKRQHLAIVVDEYGGMAGIVTMEDILEEIVGEINDEFDEKEKPEFVQTSKTFFDLDSRILVSDLNEKLGLDIPEDDFDTLGGFVFDLFGKIPSKNESIKWKNLTFKIKDIKGTRINRITMRIAASNKRGESVE